MAEKLSLPSESGLAVSGLFDDGGGGSDPNFPRISNLLDQATDNPVEAFNIASGLLPIFQNYLDRFRARNDPITSGITARDVAAQNFADTGFGGTFGTEPESGRNLTLQEGYLQYVTDQLLSEQNVFGGISQAASQFGNQVSGAAAGGEPGSRSFPEIDFDALNALIQSGIQRPNISAPDFSQNVPPDPIELDPTARDRLSGFLGSGALGSLLDASRGRTQARRGQRRDIVQNRLDLGTPRLDDIRGSVQDLRGRAGEAIQGIPGRFPAFQTGTKSAPGGLSVVGEDGKNAELVNLVPGSPVIKLNGAPGSLKAGPQAFPGQSQAGGPPQRLQPGAQALPASGQLQVPKPQGLPQGVPGGFQGAPTPIFSHIQADPTGFNQATQNQLFTRQQEDINARFAEDQRLAREQGAASGQLGSGSFAASLRELSNQRNRDLVGARRDIDIAAEDRRFDNLLRSAGIELDQGALDVRRFGAETDRDIGLANVGIDQARLDLEREVSLGNLSIAEADQMLRDRILTGELDLAESEFNQRTFESDEDFAFRIIELLSGSGINSQADIDALSDQLFGGAGSPTGQGFTPGGGGGLGAV